MSLPTLLNTSATAQVAPLLVGKATPLTPCGRVRRQRPQGHPSCTPAWQNEPPMANARRNAATAVVGSNLYAITGFNVAPDYSTANERFNGSQLDGPGSYPRATCAK